MRIRADAEGNAYIGGVTASPGFPTTPGAFQRALQGSSDAFVLKLAPNGDRIVWSTFVGGSGVETAQGLLVDPAGVVALAGSTDSTDLKPSAGAVQKTNAGGQDIYIAILSPDGATVPYLTYFGGSGSDTLAGIALGQGGNLYFTGQTASGNFPVTELADQKSLRGPSDGYLVRLSADRTRSDFSTYIGGSAPDLGTDVSVDFSEKVLVSGNTQSRDFPLLNPRVTPRNFPRQTVWVAMYRFSRGERAPDRLLASTYLPSEGGKTLGYLLASPDGKTKAAIEFGTEIGFTVIKDSSWFYWDDGFNAELDIWETRANSLTNGNASIFATYSAALPRTSQLPDLPAYATGPSANFINLREFGSLDVFGLYRGIATDFTNTSSGTFTVADVSSGDLPPAPPGAPGYSSGNDGRVVAIDSNPISQANADTTASVLNNPTGTPDPVILSTGELFEHEIDFALGGPLSLHLVRYYASALNRARFTTTALGENWMHNFDWLVFFNAPRNRVFVRSFRGRLYDFILTAGVWRVASREPQNVQFVQDGETFKFFEPLDRLIYTFNTGGFLTKIEDTNGNALIVTPGAGGLTQVSDPHGRSLRFTYSGARLVSVADQSGRTVNYAYSGDLLTSATGADGKATSYFYAAVGTRRALMTRRMLPEGNVPFSQEYDALARVNRQADSRGNALTFEFDQPGPLMTRVTDPYGAASVHRTFFSLGSVMDTVDPDGKVISHEYDGRARLTGSKDRLGAVTGSAYDSNANLILSTDERGAATRYEYTELRAGAFLYYLPSRVLYADGSSQRWQYDAKGNVTSYTDRAGQSSTFSYNAQGLPLISRTPTGAVTTSSYNPDGTVASIQYPTGDTVRFTYDNLKRPTRFTRADTSSRQYVYDASDRITEVTDERGKKTGYTYDANGRLTAVTNAMGGITRRTYDGNSRVTSITDPLGKVSRFTHDRAGRLESVTGPTGVTRRLARDRHGRIRELFDAAGKLFTVDYNGEGVPTAVTDGAGRAFRIGSDLARLFTSLTDPSGNAVNGSRDLLGRLTSIADPMGNTSEFRYDSAGRQDQTKHADGAAVQYGFTPGSQISSVTDPRGGIWQMERNAAGLLTATIDPIGITTRYQYDARGRVTRVTRNDNTTEDYTWDEASRMTKLTYSDGTAIEYAYDDLGRLLRTRDVTLGYDALGRITDSGRIRNTYDDAGRITSVTYGEGMTARYKYSNRGLLERFEDWLGTTIEYDYDGALQITGIRRSSGVNSAYTYGPEGRLSALRITGPGWEASREFFRDASGRVVREVRSLPDLPAPSLQANIARRLSPPFPPEVQTMERGPNGQIAGVDYNSLGYPISRFGLNLLYGLDDLLAEVSRDDRKSVFVIKSDGLGAPASINGSSVALNRQTGEIAIFAPAEATDGTTIIPFAFDESFIKTGGNEDSNKLYRIPVGGGMTIVYTVAGNIHSVETKHDGKEFSSGQGTGNINIKAGTVTLGDTGITVGADGGIEDQVTRDAVPTQRRAAFSDRFGAGKIRFDDAPDKPSRLLSYSAGFIPVDIHPVGARLEVRDSSRLRDYFSLGLQDDGFPPTTRSGTPTLPLEVYVEEFVAGAQYQDLGQYRAGLTFLQRNQGFVPPDGILAANPTPLGADGDGTGKVKNTPAGTPYSSLGRNPFKPFTRYTTNLSGLKTPAGAVATVYAEAGGYVSFTKQVAFTQQVSFTQQVLFRTPVEIVEPETLDGTPGTPGGCGLNFRLVGPEAAGLVILITRRRRRKK